MLMMARALSFIESPFIKQSSQFVFVVVDSVIQVLFAVIVCECVWV
jgi:hypothetical protein